MARKLTPAERHQRRTAAVSHGAYVRSPDARKLVYWRKRRRMAKLREQFPGLPTSADPTLNRLALVQIVLEGVYAELALDGVITPSGDERRLLSEARRWTREERELLRELRGIADTGGSDLEGLVAAIRGGS